MTQSLAAIRQQLIQRVQQLTDNSDFVQLARELQEAKHPQGVRDLGDLIANPDQGFRMAGTMGLLAILQDDQNADGNTFLQNMAAEVRQIESGGLGLAATLAAGGGSGLHAPEPPTAPLKTAPAVPAGRVKARRPVERKATFETLVSGLSAKEVLHGNEAFQELMYQALGGMGSRRSTIFKNQLPRLDAMSYDPTYEGIKIGQLLAQKMRPDEKVRLLQLMKKSPAIHSANHPLIDALLASLKETSETTGAGKTAKVTMTPLNDIEQARVSILVERVFDVDQLTFKSRVMNAFDDGTWREIEIMVNKGPTGGFEPIDHDVDMRGWRHGALTIGIKDNRAEALKFLKECATTESLQKDAPDLVADINACIADLEKTS